MLIRHTLLYLPAQLLGPLSQFIAAIVWTHLISPSDYGDLMIILSAQELVALLCLSWWTHYTMRYVGTIQEGPDRARFQASENAVLVATSLVQVLVTGLVLISFVQGTSLALAVIAILFTITRSVTQHLSERARASADILSYTIAQTVGPLGGTLIGLVWMNLQGGSPIIALSAYLLAQVVSLVIIWFRLDLGHRFSWPDGKLLRASIRYGAPLLLAGALGWASMNGIRLIVEYREGAAAVGLLSVGWGLGQRVIAVVAMLVTAASYPLALKYMNAGGRDKSLEQVSLNGALIVGILAPSTAGVVLVGSAAIELMVAEAFRAMSILILPVAVLAAALRNARVHFMDQVAFLVEKPNELLWMNLLEAILTLLGCVIGLQFYGLPGAAFGCLPGAVIGLLHGYWLTRGHGLKQPWRHFIKILIATCLMVAALIFLPSKATVLALTLKIGIGVMVYVFAMAILYSEDLGNLRRAADTKEKTGPATLP